MSQSLSLTAALEAVERVLDAETGDLRELAKIAGIEPEILFRRADLTGVDLRGQDIQFLLPLEVDYLGANLTDQQMRAFRSAERRSIRSRVSPAERDMWIERVEEFIAAVTTNEELYLRSSAVPNGLGLRPSEVPISLGEGDLIELLLLPIFEFDRLQIPLPASFTNNVLVKSVEWQPILKHEFFVELFVLLGDLECPVNEGTVDVLERLWEPTFHESLGDFLAYFNTTFQLDDYWLRQTSFKATYQAAMQIKFGRNVDVRAVENAVLRWMGSEAIDWQDVLNFLSDVPFECNADQAERLASYITRLDWHARHTLEILDAHVPPKMKTAIFRQILVQGKGDRIVEVVKWLENDRGAAGALTLENTLGQLKDFDLAIRLALEISPRLADNQIGVVHSVLKSLVMEKRDRDRLASFERRYVRNSS